MNHQPLIALKPLCVEDRVISTCNARDLHQFLEVQTQFKDWIARRIEEYGFEEGKDFCSNLSESTGGRPAKEYALSIDMAKELAMVERTEKGKQARQYFIECERQAKAALVKPLPLSRKASEAAKVFTAGFKIARLIGCDQNAAAISANQFVHKHTGLNVLEDLGRTHLVAENQESIYLTPTELGLKCGGLSAFKINKLLENAGLQTKSGGYWQPTASGHAFARILDTSKRHSDGALVQQIKWADCVVAALEKTPREDRA